MSGICSRHQHKEPECTACCADIRDLLPNYDEMCAEAEAAGTAICTGCDFEYYLTVNSCPNCGKEYNENS